MGYSRKRRHRRLPLPAGAGPEHRLDGRHQRRPGPEPLHHLDPQRGDHLGDDDHLQRRSGLLALERQTRLRGRRLLQGHHRHPPVAGRAAAPLDRRQLSGNRQRRHCRRARIRGDADPPQPRRRVQLQHLGQRLVRPQPLRQHPRQRQYPLVSEQDRTAAQRRAGLRLRRTLPGRGRSGHLAQNEQRRPRGRHQVPRPERRRPDHGRRPR